MQCTDDTFSGFSPGGHETHHGVNTIYFHTGSKRVGLEAVVQNGYQGSVRFKLKGLHRTDARAGLLPLLNSIHKPCNLKSFAGLTIGVDAYGWLHRGTVACAIDLALGKPTTKYELPPTIGTYPNGVPDLSTFP